jgi:hypothetical protein
MCTSFHKADIIKSQYYNEIDPALEDISQFNDINIIPFIDRDIINMCNQDPIEEVKYVIGIMMSLLAIYYFIYNTIKSICD